MSKKNPFHISDNRVKRQPRTKSEYDFLIHLLECRICNKIVGRPDLSPCPIGYCLGCLSVLSKTITNDK